MFFGFSSNKDLRITFSFVLLFGLVPYRLLGLLGVSPLWKLYLGIFFLVLFFFIVKETVPLLLNSHLLQTFFFSCLVFEEYLYRISLPLALFIAFGITFQLVLAASHTEDPFFWYSFMLLLYNLYFHFKQIFLNPEFEYTCYRDLVIENKESFPLNWDLIVLNISAISKGLFKVSVENQLGKSMSRKLFPFIAKRYISIANAFKGKSDLIAVTAVVTGLSTAAYGEYRTTIRHKESLQVSLEGSKLQAKATVEAARIKADAKTTVAKEMKRANDLKEKELILLQQPRIKDVSYDVGVQSFF